MILPCEIPQLDIPNEGRNHILEFFLIPIRKIISVQEIYSDSLFKDVDCRDPFQDRIQLTNVDIFCAIITSWKVHY